MKLYLNDLGLLCAAGNSKSEVINRLLTGDRSGLMATDAFGPSTIVGQIAGELPEIDPHYSIYLCRNNRLLLAALSQIRETINRMTNCQRKKSRQ